MFKAAIFDLDGTLLDTLQDLYASVNYALEKNHMPQRTLDEVKSFVGNGVKKLIERSVAENTTAECAERVLSDFKAHYAIHSADNTAPYPGVCEMLEKLQKNGIKVAVVSNKLDSATKELCLRYFGIKTAIGDRDGRAKKPAPDSVFEALRQLEVCAEEAVYIGDSEVDIKTAQNSRMQCICVTWGFREKDYLKANGATVFAENADELYKMISI